MWTGASFFLAGHCTRTGGTSASALHTDDRNKCCPSAARPSTGFPPPRYTASRRFASSTAGLISVPIAGAPPIDAARHYTLGPSTSPDTFPTPAELRLIGAPSSPSHAPTGCGTRRSGGRRCARTGGAPVRDDAAEAAWSPPPSIPTRGTTGAIGRRTGTGDV